MGFILTLFIISCLAAIAIGMCEKLEAGIAAFFVFILFSSIIISVVLFNSYKTYISMKKCIITVEQYKSAINMYSEKAVIDFEKNEDGSYVKIGDLTDLKYQNYQDNISRMIRDLREVIVEYNGNLISKRILNDNWYWSLCIIAPDPDMKIIKLKG